MFVICIWVVAVIQVGISAGRNLDLGEIVERDDGADGSIERLDIHDVFNDIIQNGGDSNDAEERARNVHERLIGDRDTNQPITNATIHLKNLDAGNTFVPFSNYVDEDNNETTVRYEQNFDGHPVIGDDIVLTYNKNENMKNAFGSAEKLSNSTNGDPCSKEYMVVSQEDAIRKALKTIGEKNIDSKYLKARVAIFNGECVHEFKMFFQWHIIISTKTGKVLLKESMVHTQLHHNIPNRGAEYPLFKDVSGNKLLIKTGFEVKSEDNVLRQTSSGSPGGNNKIGRHTYPDSTYGPLRVTTNGNKCIMENDHVSVYDCNNSEWTNWGCENNPQTPFEFDCPDNTHKEINGASSPLNDAFYYGDKTVQMFKDWIGIKPTCSSNGQCDKPVMYVHVGQGYENAFSFGSGLVFGDGQSTFYPLSGAMDVMAHEFAHWFTEKNSNLAYSQQSGGLNEAFSDMTGKAADYYLFGSTSNWDLGGDVFKASGQALRYMDNPPRDGRSIGHAQDYTSGMDVHLSSGVFNKAFYLLATKSGWDTKKTWLTMAKANLKFWSRNTNWDRAGDGVMDAACELGYDVNDVQSALATVGVNSQLSSGSCSAATTAGPPGPTTTAGPASCTCSDFIDEDGHGNCLKPFQNKLLCYVNEPSNCGDLQTYNGRRWSFEACGATATTTTPTPPQGQCDGVPSTDWSCCSQSSPCIVGGGDCDYDSECMGSLTCGTNNCQQDFPSSGSNWHSSADCCVPATTPTTTPPPPQAQCNGVPSTDWNCCSQSSPCNEGGGDCNTDSECIGSLTCGRNNCLPDFSSSGSNWKPGADCCIVAPVAPACDGTDPGTIKRCCRNSAPCNEGQGDCNRDSHCAGDLRCGNNNCLPDFSSAGTNWKNGHDCCYSDMPGPNPPPTTQGPNPPPTTQGPNPPPTTQGPNPPPTTQGPNPPAACGIKPQGIVGGSEVTPYSLPWQVALVSNGGNGAFCGGTLIDERHVLTASHCINSNPTSNNFDIIVGEHRISDSSDGTRHEICRAVRHPQYSGGSLTNDFAIVHLKQPVQLGTRAAPACLPTSDLGGNFLSGKSMTVSGWGTLSSGGNHPDVLHSVSVPGITNSQCNSAYSGGITSAMLCAGNVQNGGIDSCQGDSGGPMTYTVGGKATIVGVVSWGIGCAQAGFPGVYARVTEGMDFINDELAKTC